MSTLEENVGATVKRIPAFTAVKELVELVLPGAALPMARLRATIYAFCANPLASCFHIAGEIGAGKSTAARVIAMAKRLAHLDSDSCQSGDHLRRREPRPRPSRLLCARWPLRVERWAALTAEPHSGSAARRSCWRRL